MTVDLRPGIRIPLRDGVELSGTLYLPRRNAAPSPAILTLTPYIAQSYHAYAMRFAERGYPFLCVDVRGRGNSQGEFNPFLQEADDGYDVVEWLAQQQYCNGQIAMWGGSYGGYAQWVTAKGCPPHLRTIVPVASPCMGVDHPNHRNNIFEPYLLQWLMLVSGRTLQDKIIWGDRKFWVRKFREWYESGAALKDLDAELGFPSALYQEWIAHPALGEYWDRYNPTSIEYSQIRMPILTITGYYDGNQPGALTHYMAHRANAEEGHRHLHYLVIGPWDHSGTRAPQLEFGGLRLGPQSLLDLLGLHVDWYAWAMSGGEKPRFLQKSVAYYVMGADKWRYADSLDSVSDRHEKLYLQSNVNATDVFCAGLLSPRTPSGREADCYFYDPLDVRAADVEELVDPENLTDQRLIHAASGKHLVYHTDPFAMDTEVSGFFRLRVWISINQPDTDFRATIYEIDLNGGSLLLSRDFIRTRYRENLRREELIRTEKPLIYDFRRFTFISRLVRRGHRLRLVIGPVDSIYFEKNYNSGGTVSEGSSKDARVVTVTLLHDSEHPSALFMPVAKAEGHDEASAVPHRVNAPFAASMESDTGSAPGVVP